MNDLYSQVLREILVQHGRGVCDDPRRLRALLRDYLGARPGNHEQAINVLVLALENRAVSELLGSEGLPLEMVKSRLAARLHTSLGMTEQAAGWAVATWSAALAPPAAVTPVPMVSAGATAVRPGTQPMATPIQTDGPQSADQFASVTQPASAIPGLQPAHAPTRRWLPNALLVVGFLGGVALTAFVAILLLSGRSDRQLASRDSADKAGTKTAADKSSSTDTAKPPDGGAWKVIFRSADPSIWNDDVNKGPDHFAMALELVPANIRYLKLTNATAKEFVILEMTKERLRRRSGDGRYGWEGTNHFHYRVYHLGIFFEIWPFGASGDVIITRNGPARGWGFGDVWGSEGTQGYSWAGKSIAKTVFEIAVSSEPLTEAESKKLLKAGNPRE